MRCLEGSRGVGVYKEGVPLTGQALSAIFCYVALRKRISVLPIAIGTFTRVLFLSMRFNAISSKISASAIR